MLGDDHGPPAVFPHPDRQVREPLDDIKCRPGVHGGPQQHHAAGMQVHQLVSKFFAGTDGTGDDVAGPVNEFGHRMDHHVRTQFGRGYQYR